MGVSGGGKTTLGRDPIPRFYDTTEGRFCIDGQDIHGVTLESLRNNIGVAQEDEILFSGTVFENIAYGRPNTEDEVIAAAKMAGAMSSSAS